MIDNHGTYRKSILARQNTQDTTMITLDKKDPDSVIQGSTILRNENEHERSRFGSWEKPGERVFSNRKVAFTRDEP